MRSVSVSALFVMSALLGPTLGGCVPNPEAALFDNWTPHHPYRRVSGALPVARVSPSAEVVPTASTSRPKVEPGDHLDFAFDFRGGPVDRIHLAVGDRYFEFDVDPSRASANAFEQSNVRDRALVEVARDASRTEGSIDLGGVLSDWFSPAEALEAKFRFQVRGADGQFSEPGSERSIILCTRDGNCSPGGGGRPIASCSDGNVCSEILEGDADAYAAQCEANGQQGSTDGCADTYKAGHACLNGHITSQGQPVKAHMYWGPGYCAKFPHIDTKTTCELDLEGSPTGQHCTRP